MDPEVNGVPNWTNHSVIALSGELNPIAEVARRAREVVLDAMAEGWTGPPYDPFALADILGIPTVASADVRDARVGYRDGRYIIEYSPYKPKGRTRFSIAHEIGHTLFPNCADLVRNRVQLIKADSDEWQLELLCNLAAAEFLMPIGALGDVKDQPVTLDAVLDMQRTFEVSTEAILLRMAKVTTDNVAVFAASRVAGNSDESPYQVDYFSPSKSFANFASTQPLPSGSIVSRCTAIGTTARGRERWPGITEKLWIECVGVPSYPGHVFPRVVGLVRDVRPAELSDTGDGIRYLEADALLPVTPGPKIIAFVVNDKVKKWGGGFALEVSKTWPQVQTAFEESGELRLGSIHVTAVADDITTVAMVAQHGYRRGSRPGIRYPALNNSLSGLGDVALGIGASIHLPLIGAGQAGGDWRVIEELIEDNLVQRGIPVTVYVRPVPLSSGRQLRFRMGTSGNPPAQVHS